MSIVKVLIDTAYRSGSLTVILLVLFVLFIYIYIYIYSINLSIHTVKTMQCSFTFDHF